jgi:hypothetical protein
MRLDIKKVKKKDYIQVVDDQGYLHHLGPATPSNFCVALYTIGLEEHCKWIQWLNHYLERRDVDNYEKLAVDISMLHADGSCGFSPRDTYFVSGKEIGEKAQKILNRIKVVKALEKKIRKHYEMKRVTYAEKRNIRKQVIEQFKQLSDQDKQELYREQLELGIEQ